MFEQSKFESEQKRMRMAKHEDLETAFIVWFKQARFQKTPISRPLMLKRSNELAKQIGYYIFWKSMMVETFQEKKWHSTKNCLW
ncbi:hypothetical protein TNCV_4288491 [Trichonephila clavipes]|nr:hypothetical protein TNCV_4288491 [Trichonephila clavipes]